MWSQTKRICNKAEEIREEESKVFNKRRLDFYHLQLIFEHLPITDRIRIERVSKNWKHASRASWNNFKVLDFRIETWGIPKNKAILIKDKIFDHVISRCAKFLSHINFSTESYQYEYKSVKHHLNHHAVLNLLRYGPMEIKEMQILNMYYCLRNDNVPEERSCTNDWAAICQLLIRYAPKIKTFAIDYSQARCCKCEDEHFCALLTEMKSIKYFRTGYFFPFSSKYLSHLPVNNIEHIDVCRIDGRTLEKMMKTVPNLRSLDCQDFKSTKPEDFFKALFCNTKNLRNLTFMTDFLTENEDLLLSSVAKLTYIEELSLPHSLYVDDSFLQVIAENCRQLTNLSIYGCTNVTDLGITSIANLPNIRELDVSELPTLFRPPLQKMQKLEKLNCRKCLALQSEVIPNLLHSAAHLRLLDIRGNFSARRKIVYGKIVQIALNTVSIRGSSVTLNLYINNSNIIVHNRSVNQNPDITGKTLFPPRSTHIELGGVFKFVIKRPNFVLHAFEDFSIERNKNEVPYRNLDLIVR